LIENAIALSSCLTKISLLAGFIKKDASISVNVFVAILVFNLVEQMNLWIESYFLLRLWLGIRSC
jgi:hypothetical protein